MLPDVDNDEAGPIGMLFDAVLCCNGIPGSRGILGPRRNLGSTSEGDTCVVNVGTTTAGDVGHAAPSGLFLRGSSIACQRFFYIYISQPRCTYKYMSRAVAGHIWAGARAGIGWV